MDKIVSNVLIGTPTLVLGLLISCIFYMLGIQEKDIKVFLLLNVLWVAYTCIVVIPMYSIYSLHNRLKSVKRWLLFITVNVYVLFIFTFLAINKDMLYN